MLCTELHVSYFCDLRTDMQTPDTLKGIPSPFGAELDSFPPDKTLPVSVLHTEPKSMTVRDVKSMSWEQHVVIWKVQSSFFGTVVYFVYCIGLFF